MLLDGAPVRGWTTKNGTMFVRTQVTPTVPHRLTFASDFDGAGSFRSYHFRVESRHEFAVARAHDANRLTIRLFEAGEDLPLEQRPTVYWAEAGEVRGMTPPRNAR
ncbi:hypothetical protein AKJ09_04218 [Labilithrix luteola]|uniref:Uncharacterized protein n=1 Tax=Labilithrix luteola TaxID=1391654 RepID=A0A0K1PWP1_9BACT|nr:hypothetical protein AKJ09_04218 [Labilithrix luteola]